MTHIELPREPFTMTQAVQRGISPKTIRVALADGRLCRVFREVYAWTGRPLSPADRVRAVRLVTPDHLVACDRTASWIHGVDVVRFFELDVPPPIELCALRGHEPSERPEVRCVTRDLRDDDIEVIGGVSLTTRLRTAMDLGCRLPRRDAFAAMNALASPQGFSDQDVQGMLRRFRGRRGVVQLKQLAPFIRPEVESRRESWVLIEIIDFGLPLPQPQHWIVIDGVPTYHLDFAYPHAKVAVEYDGEEHHTNPQDRERDRARRAWLRDHGWTVIVLTKHDFVYDAIPSWIPRLREALRMT